MKKPLLTCCASALLLVPYAAWAAPEDKKLVVAGSSVPRGYGAYSAGQYAEDFDQDGNTDYFARYGYAGRLRDLITQSGNPSSAWTYENVAVGGNDTQDLLARFDPDVTRQYLPPKSAGSEPEYVILGLSMGNEGLAFTQNPEQVFESFKNGMLQLVEECRSRGYQPVIPMVYPHGLYSLRKYDYVKRMNLLMSTWDVPCINLLGATDDGRGRWADGMLFDDAHPNIIGHEEMFLAIPPSLFDAMEAGKTSVPQFPSSTGFVRLTADPGAPSPIRFSPSHPVHSFTVSFRVRSEGTGTVAAIQAKTKPMFLVDFGPSNDDDGRATASPDAFGHHWNNWRPQPGGPAIAAGTALPNLVTVDNTATSVGLLVTDAFSGSNGIVNGGLTNPNGPQERLLGHLASETATEDYFFDSDTAAFKVTGLDPGRRYTFRFFGTRQSSETRETRIKVTGGLPYSPFSDIITSGERIADNGIYNGNDHIIGMVSSMPPDANGEIEVSLVSDNSTTCYLGLMEISVDDGATGWGTIELRDGSIAYVSPGGKEITAAVDGGNGTWHDIALAHRYARQETLLYVDGVVAGRLRENLEPAAFTIGGPGGSGRAAAPSAADFQDWCVSRAAWNEDEALAQHEGNLQHASLEILAPMDDASFSEGAPVANAAQSLSEAIIHTPLAEKGSWNLSPSPLAAASYSSDSITLTWQDPGSGESGYSIQRRPSQACSAWQDVGSTSAGITLYTDTSLEPGVWYDYRVAAIEGSMRGAWSNIETNAAGADGQSYREWSSGHFNLPWSLYRIDFNTMAADYGGEVWNRVSSLSPSSPIPLADANSDTRAGYSLTVVDGFDQFRSGNGNPLTGYPADAQSTCFVVTDQRQPGGAKLVFSGLNRSSTYNISVFGRRSPTTTGYDNSGRYTFTGEGTEISFEKSIGNNGLIFGASLSPDGAGNITVDLSAADTPTGLVFAGISFMTLEEIPKLPPEGSFLVDFNASATAPVYPEGQTWNRIPSLSDTGVHPLSNEGGSAEAGYSYQVTTPFANSREGSHMPGILADDAERTMFNAANSGSTITFGGLDPAAVYDIIFLSRRGALVGGFDYTAQLTAIGSSTTSTIADGAIGNLGKLSGIAPDAEGTISLTVAAGPGAGTDFPVLNLLVLVPSVSESDFAPESDPDNDGNANFVEYGLATDPGHPDHTTIRLENSSIFPDTGNFTSTYTRPLGARDLEWIVETTTDLGDPLGWQPDPLAGQSVGSSGNGMETILISRPRTGDPKRFFRLRLRFLSGSAD